MNDDQKIGNPQKSTTESQKKVLDFERGKTATVSQIPPKKTSESNKIKK